MRSSGYTRRGATQIADELCSYPHDDLQELALQELLLRSPCRDRLSESFAPHSNLVPSFYTSGTRTHLPLLSDAVCNSAEHVSSRDTVVLHTKCKCRVSSYTSAQLVRCRPFTRDHRHSLQSAQSSVILRRCLVRESDHVPSCSHPNRATFVRLNE